MQHLGELMALLELLVPMMMRSGFKKSLTAAAFF